MGFRFWRRKNSRSKHAEENNRVFMKELIMWFDGKCNPIRIFTEEELSRATHNYHPHLLISRDFFEMYRGQLGAANDWPILVEKHSNFGDVHRERILNELVVVSQMKHKHVVKLLGCCLDSELPILVYEYAHVHKTLSDLIINDHPSSQLSWESRLRIATEIADAITYIHTFSSRPIIHRNIKLENIFLDHEDVATLFGFSFCIRIPDGQTHVRDSMIAVRNFENLGPMYIETRQASVKTDVYSFGVVLFEILSGQSGFKIPGGTNDSPRRGLIAQDRHLRQLVDPRITGVEEHMSDRQLEAYTNLIIKCTYTKEDERPEMIEVAKELRRIWKTTQVQPR